MQQKDWPHVLICLWQSPEESLLLLLLWRRRWEGGRGVASTEKRRVTQLSLQAPKIIVMEVIQFLLPRRAQVVHILPWGETWAASGPGRRAKGTTPSKLAFDWAELSEGTLATYNREPAIHLDVFSTHTLHYHYYLIRSRAPEGFSQNKKKRLLFFPQLSCYSSHIWSKSSKKPKLELSALLKDFFFCWLMMVNVTLMRSLPFVSE